MEALRGQNNGRVTRTNWSLWDNACGWPIPFCVCPHVGGRNRFDGLCARRDLPLLYNAADVFCYPSLIEGFGLPVLEAMACGTAVITSNVSSLPEVAGDAARWSTPTQVRIADALGETLPIKRIAGRFAKRAWRAHVCFHGNADAQQTREAYHRARGSRVSNASLGCLNYQSIFEIDGMSFFDPLIRWRYQVTGGFRRRRFAFFWNTLGQYAGTRWWLDLGGGPGRLLLTQLESLPGAAPCVLLLDMGEAEFRDARKPFSNIYRALCADGEHLPFCENAFDLVFCNSVMEHVAHPAALAAEIRRTGRRFFVQTPNEHFPLESHSHVPLPFFRHCPALAMVHVPSGAAVVGIFNVGALCDRGGTARVFPRARICAKRALGLTKSFYGTAEDA